MQQSRCGWHYNKNLAGCGKERMGETVAEKYVEEVREEFLECWSDSNVTVLALCCKYGTSPKTAYKWRNRKASGDSLNDRGRRPKSSPDATPEPVVLDFLALRKTHPTLCGKKISLMLRRKGVEGVPSGATATGILRRHDLLNERAVAEATHLRRFSNATSNEMWQVDFKQYSGERRHPLSAVDECSRYAVIRRRETDSRRPCRNQVLP